MASLKAKYINIKADDRPVINIKKFDGLLDTLIDDKGIAVIDTGTSTFDPLMTYIAEANVDAMLINENVILYPLTLNFELAHESFQVRF